MKFALRLPVDLDTAQGIAMAMPENMSALLPKRMERVARTRLSASNNARLQQSRMDMVRIGQLWRHFFLTYALAVDMSAI
jgi:hypothetical protein